MIAGHRFGRLSCSGDHARHKGGHSSLLILVSSNSVPETVVDAPPGPRMFGLCMGLKTRPGYPSALLSSFPQVGLPPPKRELARTADLRHCRLQSEADVATDRR